MRSRREAPGGAKGSMSVQEAGRRGGQKTLKTRGREFYETIGQKGGQRSHGGRGAGSMED